MRRFVLGGTFFFGLCAAATLGLASDTRYLTSAPVPTDGQLAPLGLRKLWHSHIPTAGARDHLVKMQVFGSLLVGQTSGGGVVALNAEAGQVLWQKRFQGVSTGSWAPAGANDSYVFVVAEESLFALDRNNGAVEWSITAPHLPAVSVIADDTHAYYTSANGDMVSYRIPTANAKMSVLQANALDAEKIIVKPELAWSMRMMTALEYPPILVNGRVVLPQRDGKFVLLHRDRPRVSDRIPALSPMSAPVACAENDLYIGCLDGSVSALEVLPEGAMVRWKYVGQGPMVQKALPSGKDLFVLSSHGDLACLDRKTGAQRWRHLGMKQILSATDRSLLAVDNQGQVRAFDRTYGAALGQFSASGFRMPILNDQTDRVFLANHDGLVVALRDVTPSHNQARLHFSPRSHSAPMMAQQPSAPVRPAAPAIGNGGKTLAEKDKSGDVKNQ